MTIKTFGRASSNAVVLTKADISSQHAKITQLDDGNYLVEDLNSTNGTFVNGYRINTANVKFTDEIRLSESTIIDLSKVFKLNAEETRIIPKVKLDPKDFVDEFNKLDEVWTSFNKTKLDISNKFQRNSTIFRSLVSLFPILVWVLFKTLYLDQFKESDPQKFQEWQGSFIYFSAIGGSIGNLLVGLFIKSPQEKLTQLDEEFRVRYVCPNTTCRTQLGNIPWKSYQNQGKCFRCQAKYDKSQLTI
jgi:hypothetical protein